MPDRLVIPGPGQRSQGLLQQSGKAAEVPCSVRVALRLQFRRITEPGDEVRIGVLIRLPRPVEVVQQAADVPSAEHFPNHRNTCPGLRKIPAHVFRRLIQPPDHPHTELHRREQILTPLSRGI